MDMLVICNQLGRLGAAIKAVPLGTGELTEAGAGTVVYFLYTRFKGGAGVNAILFSFRFVYGIIQFFGKAPSVYLVIKGIGNLEGLIQFFY